ncbi:MAG: HEAT repeat domain-containing protein, partial [Candidatus Hydrogenedentes bacterium]|nr:HEAT repeat domain-containing protein [Candidatus Hydrogenedentota bacterium]
LHDAAAHMTFSSDSLVAHELAHQWFGDLLTCRDWANLWLNEGFATYMELMFGQRDEGEAEFRHQLMKNQQEIIDTDKGDDRAPIMRQVYGRPDELFDVRVYEKGACVLHMLRQHLGGEIFLRGLHEYVVQHENQPVETNDLLRTMEQVSGEGLEQFFQQWIFASGYPELKVEYEWLSETSVARVRVLQTQTVDDKTPLFHLQTTLLFHLPDGDHVESVTLEEKEQVFHVRLPSKPDYVRLDPAGDLLKKLDFKKPKEMLLAQLAKDETVAGKYEACDGLQAFDDDAAVEALQQALEQDAFWGVRERAAKALAEIDNPKAFEALLKAVEQPEARLRLGLATVLGQREEKQARQALLHLAQDDSPYVAAEAIDALGKLDAPEAGPAAQTGLKRGSHVEVVRAASLRTLAQAAEADALDDITPFTQPDKPRAARRAAIGALGTAGRWMKDKSAPRRQLEDLLDDPNKGVRATALEALVTLGDPQAVEAVERFSTTSKDDREQDRAKDAVKKLREREDQTTEVKKLRESVQKLEEEGRDTKEKLDAIQSLVDALGKKE